MSSSVIGTAQWHREAESRDGLFKQNAHKIGEIRISGYCDIRVVVRANNRKTNRQTDKHSNSSQYFAPLLGTK